jgi:hypothetical protein
VYALRALKKTSNLIAAYDSSGVFLSTGVGCPQAQPVYLRVDPHPTIRHLLALAVCREGTVLGERVNAPMPTAFGPGEKTGR